MHYSDHDIESSLVQEFISDYQAGARHPDLSAFKVSKLLPIGDIMAATGKQSGVYIIYRADQTLIYFGLSLSDLNARIRQHCRPRERASNFWKDRAAAWYQTIIVTEPWEAPSLEEYLIQRAKEFKLTSGVEEANGPDVIIS